MENVNKAGGTVLIVEDKILLRLAAVAFLSDAGFGVAEAASADETLALLESRSDISTFFTDIQMSGSMDGVTLAMVVATRWPHIRLIVTSGYIHPISPPLPKEIAFLPKPYHLPAVVKLAAVTSGGF